MEPCTEYGQDLVYEPDSEIKYESLVDKCSLAHININEKTLDELFKNAKIVAKSLVDEKIDDMDSIKNVLINNTTIQLHHENNFCGI